MLMIKLRNMSNLTKPGVRNNVKIDKLTNKIHSKGTHQIFNFKSPWCDYRVGEGAFTSEISHKKSSSYNSCTAALDKFFRCCQRLGAQDSPQINPKKLTPTRSTNSTNALHRPSSG